MSMEAVVVGWCAACIMNLGPRPRTPVILGGLVGGVVVGLVGYVVLAADSTSWNGDAGGIIAFYACVFALGAVGVLLGQSIAAFRVGSRARRWGVLLGFAGGALVGALIWLHVESNDRLMATASSLCWPLSAPAWAG